MIEMQDKGELNLSALAQTPLHIRVLDEYGTVLNDGYLAEVTPYEITLSDRPLDDIQIPKDGSGITHVSNGYALAIQVEDSWIAVEKILV